MKKYKVTLLIPQERVIEAPDVQAAHNQVSKMMESHRPELNEPVPKVHSIEEVKEPEQIDFGDVPPPQEP